MAESRSRSWDIALAAGVLLFAAGTVIGIVKGRRQEERRGTRLKVKERYVSKRNPSHADLAKLGSPAISAGLGLTRNTDSELPIYHPEGINVGFSSGSSSSWMSAESRKGIPELTDQMTYQNTQLVIVMVGLPGSGKTNIAMKLARYLRWISYRCRVFSVAKYRLDKLGNKSADFFDPDNREAKKLRFDVLRTAVEDALRYLQRGGKVIIIDGTNSTLERRQFIRKMLDERDEKYHLLWIESQFDHNVLLTKNISSETLEDLSGSPDFLGESDYKKRLTFYQKKYESVQANEGSCITIKAHKRLELQDIHGFIPTKIVSFVVNLHKAPRTVYLCRHGESEFNARGLIGGDSGLTPKGFEFARALGSHLESLYPDGKNQTEGGLVVWMSTARRTRETAQVIKAERHIEWRLLRDLEVGTCDGLSYKQIQVMFPEEWRQREHDKLTYRYPRGESYLDVVNRLEPVIFELERIKKPVVIIGHQAVLRCLYGYFLDLPANMIPRLSLPLHTIIRLQPKALGCTEKRLRFVLDGDEPKEASGQRKRAMSSWDQLQPLGGTPPSTSP
jgi:broad specificity phosphatase PhoE/predicted kinase